jgi:hypothetical protein
MPSALVSSRASPVFDRSGRFQIMKPDRDRTLSPHQVLTAYQSVLLVMVPTLGIVLHTWTCCRQIAVSDTDGAGSQNLATIALRFDERIGRGDRIQGYNPVFS